MELIVNGKIHEHQGNGSIDALLEELAANKAHTALMVNGNVIPAEDWTTATLSENDEIEMLVFVGGG
jgi:thiamine biosynthesis protein ThiS